MLLDKIPAEAPGGIIEYDVFALVRVHDNGVTSERFDPDTLGWLADPSVATSVAWDIDWEPISERTAEQFTADAEDFAWEEWGNT